MLSIIGSGDKCDSIKTCKKRFLVGLGNPGRRYKMTRHNTGYRIIEQLWRKHGNKEIKNNCNMDYNMSKKADSEVFIARPLSYMNLSGQPVKDFLTHFNGRKDNLLVIHDDVNLRLGWIRFRRRGSSGGHNGIASIIESFGSDCFARLKIGVGRPDQNSEEMVDYVLNSPKAEEAELLAKVETKASEAAWKWVNKSMEICMNEFNRDIFAQEGEN